MLIKLSLLVVTLISVVACSNQQEDAIYQKTLEIARDYLDLKQKTVKTFDIDMNYLEYKPEDTMSPDTIIFAHGFSADKDTWSLFINALNDRKKYHLISLDWAGHGDNVKDLNGDYHLDTQVERLHTLIQSKNIKKFHIVGNSMGGAIAILYSIKYPSHLKSMTLMNSAGALGEHNSEFFTLLEKGTNALIPKNAAEFDIRMDMIMEQPPYLPSPIESSVERATINNYEIFHTIFDDVRESLLEMETKEFKEQLMVSSNKHQIPTLIMWGENDRVIDVSSVHKLKELIPHSELKIYKDIGHAPMIENPSTSSSDYQAFIAGID